MSIRFVTQDEVGQTVQQMFEGARKSICIASPWVQGPVIRRLLRTLLLAAELPAEKKLQPEVQLVFRVKESTDFDISSFSDLRSLEKKGLNLRYSDRLHAKIVIVDNEKVLVSSANFTATGGYGLNYRPEWRNQEGGIYIENDSAAVEGALRQFNSIWDSACGWDDRNLGMVLDASVYDMFRFATIREVYCGQFVEVIDPSGRTVIGQVNGVTAYNPSCPREAEDIMHINPSGYVPPAGEGMPTVRELFSRADKEEGLLLALTYIREQKIYHIASVKVLKQGTIDNLSLPLIPVAPGEIVRIARKELLCSMLGTEGLPVGRVINHPEVEVKINPLAVLTGHMAVLGMTGSGKSNGLKVFIRNLAACAVQNDIRIVVIDHHGEYRPIAASLATGFTIIDVNIPEGCDILDAEELKEYLHLRQVPGDLVAKIHEIADTAGKDDLANILSELAAQVDTEKSEKKPKAWTHTAEKLIRSYVADKNAFYINNEEPAIIKARADASQGPEYENLEQFGLYILDLSPCISSKNRAYKAARVIDYCFNRARKAGKGNRFKTLLVLDEAQNYIPEVNIGQLKPVINAVNRVAKEGRKFSVGLIIATQRPAAVDKDVLSQCSTHILFRLMNAQDIHQVQSTVEAANSEVLTMLPLLDTGTAFIAGTGIGMPVHVQIPIFLNN